MPQLVSTLLKTEVEPINRYGGRRLFYSNISPYAPIGKGNIQRREAIIDEIATQVGGTTNTKQAEITLLRDRELVNNLFLSVYTQKLGNETLTYAYLYQVFYQTGEGEESPKHDLIAKLDFNGLGDSITNEVMEEIYITFVGAFINDRHDIYNIQGI